MIPKILLWMNMPSHHQSSYLFELGKISELKVIYIGKPDKRRKSLGWKSPSLNKNEEYRTNIFTQLFTLFLNKNHIQVITGCGNLPNLVVFLCCIAFKIKWCHLSESLEPNNRSIIKQLITRYYYHKVQTSSLGAFAIGNKAKRSFLNLGVNDSKIFVTNYSSEVNFDLPIKSFSGGILKVVFLGSISYRKGFDLLLKSLSNVNGEVKVDFYGNIPSDSHEITSLINESSRAEYLGVLPSDEVVGILNNYHLLIFPSREDGWGMAVHEAISNNLPVICSREAGCSEHLIVNGYNGFIINPNSDEITLAINKYLECKELISEHSKHCEVHKRNFTPAKTAQVFITNLKGLILN